MPKISSQQTQARDLTSKIVAKDAEQKVTRILVRAKLGELVLNETAITKYIFTKSTC